MEIIHKIKMDLTQKGALPRVPVVQGDAFSRKMAIYLYAGKRAWKIPAGATALIRYRKPNGETGIYDTLPDGTSAVSCGGNCISVLVAPEALSQAGTATLMISIIFGTRQLTTFAIELQVLAICSADAADPLGNAWIASFLPAPEKAEIGQYFAVETVDEQGRVLSLKAVDAPTGSEEEIRAAVEAYLEDMDLSSSGIAMTHSWNGTVLTVTSASGTSSADLKGEKGETGPQGEKGETGAQGETGTAGRDGVTPHIGSNGNWWISNTDTGVKAAGSDASITVDAGLDISSENPVQNKAITNVITTIESIFENTVFPRLLPAVTSDDTGKFLQVVDGAWAAVTMEQWAGGEY